MTVSGYGKDRPRYYMWGRTSHNVYRRKMASADYIELIFSHRVLNYLSATYQGRFAFLNILSQLNHPSFNKEEVEKTKKAIEVTQHWLEQLWQGSAIFGQTVSTEQLKDQKNALAM